MCTRRYIRDQCKYHVQTQPSKCSTENFILLLLQALVAAAFNRPCLIHLGASDMKLTCASALVTCTSVYQVHR